MQLIRDATELPRFEYCAQYGRTQFNDVCAGKPNGTTSAVGPVATTGLTGTASPPTAGSGGGGGSNGSVAVPPQPPSPTASPFTGLSGQLNTAGWAVELAAIAGGFAVVLMWL